MSLPFPDTFEPGPPGPLHEPAPDDREPRTRPKLLFWDRSRIVIFLMVFFGMSLPCVWRPRG